MARDWVFVKVHPDLQVKIDRADLARVSKHRWRVTTGTTGRRRVVTSIRTAKGVRNVTLGKFLMKPPPGKQVYPRRFNEGLDYRRDNLLVLTLAERQRVLPKNRLRATSRYRGVSFVRGERRWRAAIAVKGVTFNLGHFKSEEAAALAYNRAARRHFGANAYQNRVGGDLDRRHK